MEHGGLFLDVVVTHVAVEKIVYDNVSTFLLRMVVLR